MLTFLGHNSASLTNCNTPVPRSTYIVAPVDLRARSRAVRTMGSSSAAGQLWGRQASLNSLPV